MWLVIEAMCSHNLLKSPRRGASREREPLKCPHIVEIANENDSAKTTFEIIGGFRIH
jgi:hypothetical protein